MSKRGDNDLSIAHENAIKNMRQEAIVRDYLIGTPIADIAAKYDISAGAVGAIRRKFNLPKRHPGLDADVRDKVAEDYRLGVKIKTIRDRYGVDRKTIWEIAKERGIPGRLKRRKT